MSAAIERLRQEIEQNESAVESALTLINGFVSRLRQALSGEDVEGEVSQLADELDASNVKLATAVAEGSAAAEDSDSFYDPTPVGEAAPETPVAESDTGDADAQTQTVSDTTNAAPTDTSADEATPADETEAVGDAEEVSGDTEGLPTGDDVVEANTDGNDGDTVDESDGA